MIAIKIINEKKHESSRNRFLFANTSDDMLINDEQLT